MSSAAGYGSWQRDRRTPLAAEGLVRPSSARQGSPRAYQKQQNQLRATTDEARALLADEEVLGVVAADRGQQRTQVAFDWESEAKALARENREKEVTVARLVKTREHKQRQAETQMLRYSELVSDEASRAPADEDLPTRRDVVIASMPTASKMLATDVERLLSPRLEAAGHSNPLKKPLARDALVDALEDSLGRRRQPTPSSPQACAQALHQPSPRRQSSVQRRAVAKSRWLCAADHTRLLGAEALHDLTGGGGGGGGGAVGGGGAAASSASVPPSPRPPSAGATAGGGAARRPAAARPARPTRPSSAVVRPRSPASSVSSDGGAGGAGGAGGGEAAGEGALPRRVRLLMLQLVRVQVL